MHVILAGSVSTFRIYPFGGTVLILGLAYRAQSWFLNLGGNLFLEMCDFFLGRIGLVETFWGVLCQPLLSAMLRND